MISQYKIKAGKSTRDRNTNEENILAMPFHASLTTQDDVSKSVKPGVYAWIVFALVFGLMLSDYMSRQVMNSLPFSKSNGLDRYATALLVSVVA